MVTFTWLDRKTVLLPSWSCTPVRRLSASLMLWTYEPLCQPGAITNGRVSTCHWAGNTGDVAARSRGLPANTGVARRKWRSWPLPRCEAETCLVRFTSGTQASTTTERRRWWTLWSIDVLVPSWQTYIFFQSSRAILHFCDG